MAELTLRERLRTAHVKRWHIVRVGREQSIAEHMYLVWVLTTELCERMNFDRPTMYAAQQWALLHDQPEVKIGDLPTPTKIALRNGADDSLIDTLEDGVSEIVSELHAHILHHCPHAIHAVKLMDMVESIRFLSIERMDPHGSEVRDYLWRLFHDHLARGQKELFPSFNWNHAQNILFEVTK